MTIVRDELIRLQWEGVDGSVWELSGPGVTPGVSPVSCAPGPKGFWETPRSTIWRQGAYQETASYDGDKVDMMTAVMRIDFAETADMSVQQVYSKFRRAWSTKKQGALVATSRYGTRRLRLQLIENLGYEPEYDPAFNGTGFVTVQARPTWPFWTEDDVFDVFQAINGGENSNRVNLSTPIVLPNGSGQNVSYSTVYRAPVRLSNPTDWPCYVKYTIENPVNGSVVRVQIPDLSWETDPDEDDYEHRERAIWVPSIDPGENVVVDTYPDNLTLWSSKNPMAIGRLAGIEWEFPIPEDTDPMDVPITATAPGVSVLVEMKRNWSSMIGGW
ncbi:hypothetical protein [Rhodococcoides fascians]|uniref:hypothetical protein n=1 Tax=Rhodococcoides fascians TaxID=1828 RepID=UPI000522FF94|nr:hypothetical protein [Rhodococcus fascians]